MDFGNKFIKKIGRETGKIFINVGKEILKDFNKSIGIESKNNNSDNKEANEEDNYIIPNRFKNKKGIKFGIVKSGLFSETVKFNFNDYRHKVIIGSTGAGKTEWAKNYVVNKGKGACYIDNADGRAINDILKALPEDRLKDVILLDHSNKHKPLPIGTMKSTDDIFQNDMLVNQWVNFFIRNFGIEDQYMTIELISYACKLAFVVNNTTIFDVVHLVKNEGYRQHLLKQLDYNNEHKDIIEYWQRFNNNSDAQKKQITASFLRRAGIIFRDRFLKCTLGYKNDLNYRQWMDEGKIVLINVPESLGKQAVRIIVSLHVLSFWRAALSRDDIPENKRKPFMIISDEPQSWLGKNEDIIDDMFSKARKYHLGFMCLFQSVKQIIKKSSRSLLDIMLDNRPDLLVFNTSNKQFDLLNINPEDIEKYHFICSTREGYFKAQAPKPINTIRKDIKLFKQRYRTLYNVNYKEIEQEIERRVNSWQNTVEKKSKSQKNGSETSANHESQKEIEKYSDL